VKPWSGIEELAFHAFKRPFSRTQTAPRSMAWDTNLP
jgi:hypothetical protein